MDQRHYAKLTFSNPPLSFLWREKRKRAVHGPKEKSVLKGAVQNFSWYFCKRKAQIDLPLRRTPLPLLRWAERLVRVLSTTGSSDSGKRRRSNQ
jgi:hypothetical protein